MPGAAAICVPPPAVPSWPLGGTPGVGATKPSIKAGAGGGPVLRAAGGTSGCDGRCGQQSKSCHTALQVKSTVQGGGLAPTHGGEGGGKRERATVEARSFTRVATARKFSWRSSAAPQGKQLRASWALAILPGPKMIRAASRAPSWATKRNANAGLLMWPHGHAPWAQGVRVADARHQGASQCSSSTAQQGPCNVCEALVPGIRLN